jgi:regulator of protease activity HflC (stomatin/prohibitin superfamily)
MSRKWVLATILAGALAAIVTAQSAPKFLTNDDVVSMVKAGQDVDTIVSAIQNQGTDFDVSAKAVLQLRKSGVPKKVIDAMVGAVKDQKEAAAAVLSAAQAKIAEAEAEDKAEEAKAEAAKAARAKAAAT